MRIRRLSILLLVVVVSGIGCNRQPAQKAKQKEVVADAVEPDQKKPNFEWREVLEKEAPDCIVETNMTIPWPGGELGCEIPLKRIVRNDTDTLEVNMERFSAGGGAVYGRGGKEFSSVIFQHISIVQDETTENMITFRLGYDWKNSNNVEGKIDEKIQVHVNTSSEFVFPNGARLSVNWREK